MSTHYGWGSNQGEDSFETFDEQEAFGADGEASYDQEQGGYGLASQEAEAEPEGVFDETEEMELASDLLSLGSEAELNQAVGKLMHSAARAVGGSLTRDVGIELGNAIKGAAQQAMSAASTPGVASGEMFGIETEGLSGEDQDFEVMRRLVRFAGAAAGRAARAPRRVNPRTVVRSSLVSAARRFAPGMLRRWSAHRHRGQDWQRRRWLARQRQRWAAQQQPYGYQPYPSPYPQPYPPPYPGAQPPPAPFDPSVAGGFGGAPDASGAPFTPGMPDAGGGDAGVGTEGPLPQAGRWTRQNGQLTIHL